jgi:lantibiotic modifying enzyme
MGHNATPFAPGFFRGMAGIGYQLLRLADPNSLPSVLLWG